ncbi:DarT ssDNA thymidine ADP-ribosyltransferase family protein [Parafrigoribacterium soli]|uniref:DarT ssDNA thymidine ADP-ribosyltransferase family protein n=1 Tax=Parafrigoribacterium soli TaxID=3144663 RepID=UPI0032EE4251
MTEECIHGLDIDRCDICSPKAKPAPVAATTARTRAPRASTAGTVSRRREAPTAKHKPVILAEQRVHHLTHIDNLIGILVDGALHADADAAWQGRPEVDISSPDTRDARRSTHIAGTGHTVADYVPFFLSPDATIWEGMLARTPDPRLAPRARALPASEFIMLVTTIKQLVTADGPYPVVADGDAGDARTRFATTKEDSEQLLRRLLGSDDGVLLRSELLVAEPVPFERVSLIGVANERARADVRALLAGSAHQPRVAVHPPWFALATA